MKLLASVLWPATLNCPGEFELDLAITTPGVNWSSVLKPRGEFLLMVIAKDRWLNFTWGPIFMHMRNASPAGWANLLRGAGFEVVEQGTRPMTLYFLARKP